MKKTLVTGIFALLLASLILIGAVSASPDWCNTDFTHRRQLTISHINASAPTLVNYPAFINVSNVTGMQQADWDDRYFYDSACNLVAFELENYTDDCGLYWVNITSLPNSGQTLWLYYGNDTVSSAANPTAVWDSSVKMVHHLQNMNDSTSYGNDGTNNNADYTASGKIDGAYDFDGSTSYLNCGNDPSLALATFTVEVWFKTTSSAVQEIVSKDAGSRQYCNYNLMCHECSIRVFIGSGNDFATLSSSSTGYNDGEWHHAVVTFDNTSQIGTVYVDGVANTPVNIGHAAWINSYSVNVGARHWGSGGEYWFNGTIDEVRIYNWALSADEINLSYQLATNQSGFVGWGGAEGYGSAPTNLQNTYNNFRVNWTWEAGSGGSAETDSFNVSWSNDTILSWQNSTMTYLNRTTAPHDWVNLSVWGYNATQSKLSETSANGQQQMPNSAPVITNTSGWSGGEGELVYLDFDYTDLDADTCTFSTNATEGSLNYATGVFEWYTGMGDQGTYYWNFTVSDGWGGGDSYIATVAVGVNQPNITTWYNNYTYNNLTTFTVLMEDNRTVFFNASANQTIDYWVWHVDGTLYQNSSVNNITKTWTEGGNKNVSVYGVNINGQTTALTWNIEIEYTVHEYAKLIYHQNLLLLEAEKMLAQMWIFLVLLIIDFSMILFFFANTRNRIYGNVAVGLLSVFLTFILAHRALLYPVEMPDLSLFLNGIALVMLVFTILVIIEIVIEKMQKSVS